MGIKKRIIRLIAAIIIAAFLFQAAACGTILYPERRGTKSGRIDPAVVILDGLGCLLFIIPGLIAFIVDFATGAIYLPPGHKSILDSSTEDTEDLPVASIDTSTLDLNTLELLLAAKTGQTIDLDSDNLKVYKVNDPEAFNAHLVR